MKDTYLQKRSMRVAGHRTSLALEPEVWAALEKRARTRGMSIPMLVADIRDDKNRPKGQSLASAVRCYVIS